MDSPSPGTLRAPRRSGGTLIEPPLIAVGGVLSSNAAGRCDSGASFFGRPLCDLAVAAQRRLLAEATQYTRQYRDVDLPAEPRRLVLAGHQPELFHPGVWFKHFVLDRIAREHNAIAVNLVVDTDICKRTSIRVPSGSSGEPRVETIPFDAASAVMPWEERPIVDRATFDAFGARVAAAIAPLVKEPLVNELWPLAVAAANRGEPLGRALAQARHAYEATFGLQTLELPLSSVCRGEEFAWFAAWLIANAAQVRDVYNTAVHDYRRANRIRSASHPVPDLTVDGDWCEAPLRVWSRDDPQRRRLFVTRRGAALVLGDRHGWQYELPPEGDPKAIVERLVALDAGGIRLRPRALATTLYARVVLGDLFIHGIGGAKYDEVTDRLIERLFELAPPAYMTATATLLLPIPHERGAAAELRQAEKDLRDLQFHAEAVLPPSDDPAWQGAVAEKRHGIEAYRRLAAMPQWDRDLARQCHVGITAANEALAAYAQPHRDALLVKRSALNERLRVETLLESREYAFCLFPRQVVDDVFRNALS